MLDSVEMHSRFSSTFLATLFLGLTSRVSFGQDPPPVAPPPKVLVSMGVPARATPGDYQSHAQAGNVTIAAEFTGHSIATPEAIFSNEDYVAVEVALFGPADKPLKVSIEDFTLRINGKKTSLAAQPYATLFGTLKDPEWEPSAAATKAGSTSFNSGGKGNAGDPPPPPPKMPMPLRRAMEQKVQKAALREGERSLPEAGLIFFSYRGKVKSIQSLELMYAGAAGKATVELQP